MQQLNDSTSTRNEVAKPFLFWFCHGNSAQSKHIDFLITQLYKASNIKAEYCRLQLHCWSSSVLSRITDDIQGHIYFQKQMLFLAKKLMNKEAGQWIMGEKHEQKETTLRIIDEDTDFIANHMNNWDHNIYGEQHLLPWFSYLKTSKRPLPYKLCNV